MRPDDRVAEPLQASTGEEVGQAVEPVVERRRPAPTGRPRSASPTLLGRSASGSKRRASRSSGFGREASSREGGSTSGGVTWASFPEGKSADSAASRRLGPVHDLQPDPQGAERDAVRASRRAASPNPSGWSRPDRPRAPRAQARQVGHVGGRVRMMVGEGAEPDDLEPEPFERPAETLRVADPAERADRRVRPGLDERDRPARRRRSGRAGHDVPRPSGAARPARSASVADRSPRSTRRPGRPGRGRPPRPAAATRPARGAARGGRAGPGRTGRARRAGRGRGRGPAGGAGTRRRGRAARVSSSSTATRARSTRSAVLEVGDVGQVLLEDPPLVVQPLGLAVAPAQDRDPDARARDTSGAIHSTIGVLPVPPSVRLPTETTGTAGAVGLASSPGRRPGCGRRRPAA